MISNDVSWNFICTYNLFLKIIFLFINIKILYNLLKIMRKKNQYVYNYIRWEIIIYKWHDKILSDVKLIDYIFLNHII